MIIKCQQMSRNLNRLPPLKVNDEKAVNNFNPSPQPLPGINLQTSLFNQGTPTPQQINQQRFDFNIFSCEKQPAPPLPPPQ